MSLLGTLDQFRLPNVLQRIESHGKTGLLVVRQGMRWVEFHVRDGRLLCVGPVRTSATLTDRLLQDKIISQSVWQEMKSVLGEEEQCETRVVITLMERGDVTREQLRAWTTEKSCAVLSAVLAWTSGEIYFDEGTQPPADRLLVSMSISSLITTASGQFPSPQTQPIRTALAPVTTAEVEVTQVRSVLTPVPTSAVKTTQVSPSLKRPGFASIPPTSAKIPAASPLAFAKSQSVKPKADITGVPTLMGASQFLSETVSPKTTGISHTALPETDSFTTPFFDVDQDSELNFSLPDTNEISFASLNSIDALSEDFPPIYAEPVKNPSPPRRSDTSYMQPDMVLVPADVSALREQNPKMQITPDQWRILTCVDGRNSLQTICQNLGLAPDVVCLLVGDLVVEGLIHVVPPEQVQVQMPMSASPELSTSGLANAYVAPSYTASSATPWSAAVPALPSTDVAPHPSIAFAFETESQWGNGENGTTFVPGRGWITVPQPVQPLRSSGPLGSPSGVYALAGSGRR